MQTSDTESIFYTLHQAKARLNLGETSVRRLVQDGALDGRKAGRRLLITTESVNRYAASLPRAGRES